MASGEALLKHLEAWVASLLVQNANLKKENAQLNDIVKELKENEVGDGRLGVHDHDGVDDVKGDASSRRDAPAPEQRKPTINGDSVSLPQDQDVHVATKSLIDLEETEIAASALAVRTPTGLKASRKDFKPNADILRSARIDTRKDDLLSNDQLHADGGHDTRLRSTEDLIYDDACHPSPLLDYDDGTTDSEVPLFRGRERRTVILQHLPAGTDLFEILQQVRTGPVYFIDRFKVVVGRHQPEKCNSWHIYLVFVHASSAAEFVNQVNGRQTPLSARFFNKDGHPAKAMLLSTPTYPMSADMQQGINYQGWTRVLRIVNPGQNVTPGTVRGVGPEHPRHDAGWILRITYDPGDERSYRTITVHYRSVEAAVKAGTAMLDHPAFDGCGMSFLRDPCGEQEGTTDSEEQNNGVDGVDGAVSTAEPVTQYGAHNADVPGGEFPSLEDSMAALSLKASKPREPVIATEGTPANQSPIKMSGPEPTEQLTLTMSELKDIQGRSFGLFDRPCSGDEGQEMPSTNSPHQDFSNRINRQSYGQNEELLIDLSDPEVSGLEPEVKPTSGAPDQQTAEDDNLIELSSNSPGNADDADIAHGVGDGDTVDEYHADTVAETDHMRQADGYVAEDEDSSSSSGKKSPEKTPSSRSSQSEGDIEEMESALVRAAAEAIIKRPVSTAHTSIAVPDFKFRLPQKPSIPTEPRAMRTPRSGTPSSSGSSVSPRGLMKSRYAY